MVFFLPVVTANVKRTFSSMNFVKNRLRNRMNDDLLNDCLITFIKQGVVLNVKEKDTINSFYLLDYLGPIRTRSRL
jgi:hypothetical protein